MQISNPFHISNKSPEFSLPFFIPSSKLKQHAQLPFGTNYTKLLDAFPHLKPNTRKDASKNQEKHVDVTIIPEEEVYGDFYDNLPTLSSEFKPKSNSGFAVDSIKKVDSIEISEIVNIVMSRENVQIDKSNAKLNHLTNIRFHLGE